MKLPRGGADKRFLSGVQPLMRFQLSGLREGLDAAWVIADIWPFPGMCSHMGL